MLRNHTTDAGWFQYPNLMMNTSYLFCRFLSVPILVSGFGWDQTYVVAYTSRLVSVGFYLLTALFIAKAVALLFDLKRAPFALLFVGLIGALNHQAHLGTVNTSLIFGIGLSIYFFARTCKTRRELDFYFSVAASSLAVGGKYNGVFLFAALPILWRWVFPRFSLKALLRPLGISAVIAPAVFLLTTPYALLDSPTFMRDISNDLYVEGPAFSDVGWSRFLNGFKWSYLGFFSAWVEPAMAVVLLSTLVYFSLTAVGTWRRGAFREETWPIYLSMLALAAAFLASLLVAYRIGNYQSRHYLPGAIVLAAMFLIAWYYWRSRLNGRQPWARFCVVGLGAGLLLLSSINTYVHIWVFSSSAKTQTLGILQDALKADPRTTFGAIAYSARSPFQRGIIDSHVDFFHTNVAAYDIDSWDQYLAIIRDHFAQSKPRYIVFEDIILSWPVFIPKKYVNDYGKRFDYPNPGPPAWNVMLESLGYRRERIVESPVLPRLLRGLIGQGYLYTAEGVGGKVYIYERMVP